MPLASSLEISASGLTAERLRMDTISNNLANLNTTRTKNGGPYRRQQVVFSEQPAGEGSFADSLRSAQSMTGHGVCATKIDDNASAFKEVHDPSHPDAVNGIVKMPNVEPVSEMVDLISATRAYEAGVTVIGAAKQMTQKALEIGKG
jgi:flagellar basal-body rod protein FlgC